MGALFSLLTKGGFTMLPLMACSMISLTIVIERFFSLRKIDGDNSVLISKVRMLIKSAKIDLAIKECRDSRDIAASIFMAGLSNAHLPKSEMKEVVEEAGNQEIPQLEKYLGVLATIAHIAPLLGLLGTVVGMIAAFDAITMAGGTPETAALAGGISVALITTATGLIVAIPTVIFLNYFTRKVDNMVLLIENSAVELVNNIVEARRSNEPAG